MSVFSHCYKISPGIGSGHIIMGWNYNGLKTLIGNNRIESSLLIMHKIFVRIKKIGVELPYVGDGDLVMQFGDLCGTLFGI